MNHLRTYAVSAVTMLALDLLWLGVIAPPLYKREVGALMRAQPNMAAAALFYAVYLVGVNVFVLQSLPAGATRVDAALRGGAFGLVAYATFDLTALAVLNGWTPFITAVDIAWGAALTAIVSAAAFSGSVRPR